MGTAIDQQAAATASELAAAQSEADKASATAAAARSLAAQGQGDAVTEVIGSPVITDLKRQQAELASQAAEIKVRYGPDHPKTKRVVEQLADIDGRITREECLYGLSPVGGSDLAQA